MYLIYGRPNCKYCDAAIGLAKGAGVSFDYIDISKDEQAYKQVVDVWRLTTVPQILYRDESSYRYIGGFDAFKRELDDTDPKKDVPENGT